MKNRVPLYYAGNDQPRTWLKNTTRAVLWNNRIRFVSESDANELVSVGGPFYRAIPMDDLDPEIESNLPVPISSLKVVEDVEKGGQYLVLNGETQVAIRAAKKAIARARLEPVPEPEPEPDPEPAAPMTDEEINQSRADTLAESISQMDEAEVEAIKNAELRGKKRKTVIKAAEARLDELANTQED